MDINQIVSLKSKSTINDAQLPQTEQRQIPLHQQLLSLTEAVEALIKGPIEHAFADLTAPEKNLLLNLLTKKVLKPDGSEAPSLDHIQKQLFLEGQSKRSLKPELISYLQDILVEMRSPTLASTNSMTNGRVRRQASGPPELRLRLKQDTGASDTDNVTNDGTVEVHGAKKNTCVIYRFGESTTWHESTDCRDRVGDAFQIPLPEGRYEPGSAYTLEVKYDETSKQEPHLVSLDFELTVDTTPPEQPEYVNAVPPDAQYGAGGKIFIKSGGLKVKTPELAIGGSVKYRIKDGEWQDLPQDYTIQLEPGVYQRGDIQAKVIDKAGNESEIKENEVEIEVDNTPPARLTIPMYTRMSGQKPGIFELDSLEPGARWEYTLDGRNWIKGEGSKQFNLPARTDYVPGQVKLRQIDQASNRGEETVLTAAMLTPVNLRFSLAEDTGASAADKLTKNGKIRVEGVEARGRLIYRYREGDAMWQPSIDHTIDLPEGHYSLNQIEVIHIDALGNESSPFKVPFALKVDTTPPLQTRITLPPNLPTGDTKITTNRFSVQVGPLAPGESAKYKIKDGAWQDLSPDNTIQLEPGVYQPRDVQIKVIDQAGNESKIQYINREIEVDTTPPAPLTIRPSYKRMGSNADGIFELDSLEPGARWEYTLDGRNWIKGEGSKQFNLPARTDYVPGQVKLRQIDQASNRSEETVLTAAMLTPVNLRFSLAEDTGASAADKLTKNGKIRVEGVEAGGRLIYRYREGDAMWQPSIDHTIDLPEGHYSLNQIEVIHIDALGNESSPFKVPFALKVDTTPPLQTRITLPPNLPTGDTKITTNRFSVQVGPLAPGESAKYKIKDGAWQDLSPDNTIQLEPGVYQPRDVQIKVVDQAGNESKIQYINREIEVDTTPPAPLTIRPSYKRMGSNADGIFELDSLEPGARWEYTLDGRNWIKGEGSKQFNLPARTDYVPGQVKLRQIDQASNRGEETVLTAAMLTPVNLRFSLAEDTGASAADKLTKNGKIRVEGVEARGRLIYRYREGDAMWQPSIDHTIDLPEGHYSLNQIEVIHIDALGNESSPFKVPFALKVDTTPPLQTRITLPPNLPTGDTKITTNRFSVQVGPLAPGESAKYKIKDGAWQDLSPDNTIQLEPGVYQPRDVQIKVIDQAGNESKIQYINREIEVDTTPPAPLTIRPSYKRMGSNADGIFELDSLEPGARWEYTLDGRNWIKGEGSKQFNLPARTDYVPGQVKLRQIDQASNRSEETVLTAAMLTPVNLRFSLAEDTGASAADKLTKNGKIRVEGVEAGGRLIYRYREGDAMWQPSIDHTIDLPEGHYSLNQIEVIHIDALGNESSPFKVPFALKVDTTPPLQTRITLPPNLPTGDTKITTNRFSVQVGPLAPGESAKYKIKDGAWQDLSPDNTIQLEPGVYQPRDVQIKVVDQAGNESKIQYINREIEVDTTPPAPLTIRPSYKRMGSNADGIFELDSLEPGARWEYTLDGRNWIKGEGSKQFNLPARTDYVLGQVKLRQIDQASNRGEETVLTAAMLTPVNLRFSLAEDTGASATDKETKNGKIRVEGVEAGGRLIYRYRDGGRWQPSIDRTIDLPEGGYSLNQIEVIHIDALGNESSPFKVPFALKVDQTLPAPPEYSLPHANGATVEYNKITAQQVSVLVNPLAPGESAKYKIKDGVWNNLPPDNTIPLGPGVYRRGEVQIKVIDQAGNESIKIIHEEIEVDTTPPAPLTIGPLYTRMGSNAAGIFPLGPLEPGARWEYTLDGETWNKGPEGSDQFILPARPDYVPGRVKLRQIDQASNRSAETVLTAAMLKPVNLRFSLEEDTGASATDKVTQNGKIRVDGVEAGGRLEYRYRYRNVSYEGRGSGNTIELPEGEHLANTIEVIHIDRSGQRSTPVRIPFAFTVDITAPNSGIELDKHQSAHVEGNKITAQQVAVGVKPLEAGASLEYRIRGGNWKPFPSGNKIILEAGPYPSGSIQVQVTDRAGNRQTLSVANEIEIDTAPPAALVLKPRFSRGAVKADQSLANASASSRNDPNKLKVPPGQFELLTPLEPRASLEYTVDGGRSWHKNADNTMLTIPPGYYDRGKVKVRQRDLASNVGKETTITPEMFRLPDWEAKDAFVNLPREAAGGEDHRFSNQKWIEVQGIGEHLQWEFSCDGGQSWRKGEGTLFSVPDNAYKPDTIQLRQFDIVGNQGVAVTYPVRLTVDSVRPARPKVNISRSGERKPNVPDSRKVALLDSKKVSIEVEGGATVEHWDVKTQTWKPLGANFMMLEDSHYPLGSLKFRAVDRAGNVSEETLLPEVLPITGLDVLAQIGSYRYAP